MLSKTWIRLFGVLLIFFVGDVASAQDYMPDEVLIKFNRGVSKQHRHVAINSVRGTVVGTFRLDSDLLHVKVPATIGTDRAISNLARNPNVQYAVRNSIYYLTQDQLFPDDKRFKQQWALNNGNDADVDAPEAWSIFTGSRDIIVAVLDTGIDYNHEDLADNMWVNELEILGVTDLDDDDNGYVDDYYGYDFAYDDSDPIDVQGHGTMCAGVIGAVGNNRLGIAGINWTVRIMAIKTHKDSGFATAAAVVAGIDYAIENGAHITSNSWGNRADKESPPVKDAINRAHVAGLLCIFAAGNDNVDTDNPDTAFYPSSFDLDNIISVTATDRSDNQHYNWGQITVDMAGCSPGIATTVPGDQYTRHFNGTSAACPHVAGVAALVWGYDPGLSHTDIKQRLMDTVRPVPSLDGMCVTEGTVNAYNALNAGGPPPSPPAAPTDLVASAAACDQIDLNWLDNANNETGFTIERSLDGSNFSQLDTVGADVTSYEDTSAGSVTTYTTYWYRVRAFNSGGDSSYSNIASATTPICPAVPPAAPTNLTAKARGKNKIALSWNDVSNNEEGFSIHRSPTGGAPSVGPNTTSYVDAGLDSKTTYSYWVCAYKAGYEESCSDVAYATTK